MIEIGRICMKIAGRDAGKMCVIIDVLDDNFVMIDGETRRRKCNFNHLEPINQTIKISKGADHDTVAKELEKLGMSARSTKPKAKTQRPKRVRKKKEAPKAEVKKAKPAKKPEEKPAEVKAEKKAEAPKEKPKAE